jgi:hypothetical protein
MLEIAGGLWDFHATGRWVAITTNPIINAKGNLAMGRGVAPAPPYELGGREAPDRGECHFAAARIRRVRLSNIFADSASQWSARCFGRSLPSNGCPTSPAYFAGLVP